MMGIREGALRGMANSDGRWESLRDRGAFEPQMARRDEFLIS